MQPVLGIGQGDLSLAESRLMGRNGGWMGWHDRGQPLDVAGPFLYRDTGRLKFAAVDGADMEEASRWAKNWAVTSASRRSTVTVE
jgi:hypothetical protein